MADETSGNSNDNSLASRIIKEREKRKWTQKTLVEKTGLRPKIVYEIEHGEAPTVKDLERFAKAFGMYVEDLTRGTERTRFSAPLGKSVRITILFATILVIAVAFLPIWEIAALLYAVYAGCLLYSVQGYAIDGDTLCVNRLLWKTKIPLAGLNSVTVEKGAMKRSLRLFGNGGLFAYVGRFRSNTLGSYKAYVTDLNRTVILKVGEKTMVVSPDDPETFARAAKSLIKA